MFIKYQEVKFVHFKFFLLRNVKKGWKNHRTYNTYLQIKIKIKLTCIFTHYEIKFVRSITILKHVSTEISSRYI